MTGRYSSSAPSLLFCTRFCSFLLVPLWTLLNVLLSAKRHEWRGQWQKDIENRWRRSTFETQKEGLNSDSLSNFRTHPQNSNYSVNIYSDMKIWIHSKLLMPNLSDASPNLRSKREPKPDFIQPCEKRPFLLRWWQWRWLQANLIHVSDLYTVSYQKPYIAPNNESMNAYLFLEVQQMNQKGWFAMTILLLSQDWDFLRTQPYLFEILRRNYLITIRTSLSTRLGRSRTNELQRTRTIGSGCMCIQSLSYQCKRMDCMHVGTKVVWHCSKIESIHLYFN